MRLFRFDRPTETADGPQTVRVLHVAQSIAGGIASYFEEIAGYQNEAFGEENVNFLIPADSEHHIGSIDPSQVTSFPSRSRRPGALVDFARTAMRTVEQFRPDIIHLHSSFAGALRPFLPSQREAPQIVYCPHGWAFGMEVSGSRKLAYAALERRLAQRTGLIIVNSKSEYALAQQYGLPAEKLRIVHNGVSSAPRPRRDPKAAGISVAFIGRHDRQKGLDILLDTIERFRLPHIHFHIVGEAVWSGSRLNAHGRSNVTFHGWLSRAATNDLLGRVDAVVMPSRWEAFGLVAIEAMRAGVPVIASDRGALPEVVAHGTGGYIFNLDDRDSLGLLLMHLDRSELHRLGLSARERWERNFVADRMNSQTEQAYRQLLSQTARRTDSRVSASPDIMPELIG